jgi:hypothetical protein
MPSNQFMIPSSYASGCPDGAGRTLATENSCCRFVSLPPGLEPSADPPHARRNRERLVGHASHPAHVGRKTDLTNYDRPKVMQACGKLTALHRAGVRRLCDGPLGSWAEAVTPLPDRCPPPRPGKPAHGNGGAQCGSIDGRWRSISLIRPLPPPGGPPRAFRGTVMA